MLKRCERCSNFMNWQRLWGNLWRCLGCGKEVVIVCEGDDCQNHH